MLDLIILGLFIGIGAPAGLAIGLWLVDLVDDGMTMVTRWLKPRPIPMPKWSEPPTLPSEPGHGPDNLRKHEQMITDQALEIDSLREWQQEATKALASISSLLVGIGGPLNDNVLQYTAKQLAPLHEVLRLAESLEESTNES